VFERSYSALIQLVTCSVWNKFQGLQLSSHKTLS